MLVAFGTLRAQSKVGHLKLSEITSALLVEHHDKLAAETYTCAKPQSKRTTLKRGEQPRRYKIALSTAARAGEITTFDGRMSS